MTTAKCKKSGKKHSPIKTKSQTRFFGRELSEKQKGDGSRSEMSMAEIKRHLEERKGKKLPEGKSSYPGGFRKRRYHS